GDSEAEDDDCNTGGDEGDERDDLDKRETELQLAEELDADHIDSGDEEDDGEHPDPAGHARVPEPNVHADRGGVEDGDEEQLDGEGPTDEKSREGLDVAGGVLAEGSRDGVADDEFSEGAHHHEHSGTADDVDEQHCGSVRLDRLGGTHEQTRADG